jgi:hypothetical protein
MWSGFLWLRTGTGGVPGNCEVTAHTEASAKGFSFLVSQSVSQSGLRERDTNVQGSSHRSIYIRNEDFPIHAKCRLLGSYAVGSCKNRRFGAT